MRLVLTAAVLLIATGASAQTQPRADRYGPRESAPAAAPAKPPPAAAPAGRMLSWSRKVAPTAPTARGGYAQPRRLPGGLYASAPVPAAPAPRAVRPAPQAQAQVQAPAPQAPLPDSLYSRPAAPAPQAAAQPRPTPYASSRPRSYSLHRQYGGAPDPIPAAAPGTSWASRPETSLIEPINPPKKNDPDRLAAEADGDWGASGGSDLLAGTD